MTDFEHSHDDLDMEDDEPLEAYCVKCKDKVEMEEPQPVWTRKGSPGTRGFCPICGTTVFRMGRTPAHQGLKKPRAVKVAEGASSKRQQTVTQAVAATYVNYADGDAVFAHELADNLNNMGVQTWLPRADNGDVAWAGGIHPALRDCTQMLVILTGQAAADEQVQAAWRYFREERKRIVVALKADVEVPDDLRRAPRIDFRADFRPALRELVQALAE